MKELIAQFQGYLDKRFSELDFAISSGTIGGKLEALIELDKEVKRINNEYTDYANQIIRNNPQYDLKETLHKMLYEYAQRVIRKTKGEL